MFRGIPLAADSCLLGLMVVGLSLTFNFALNSGVDLWWAFVFSTFGYYLGRHLNE